MSSDDVPLRDYFNQRFIDQDRAVSAALAAAKEAVDKAEREGQRWRDNANEWRGAMSDRERNFLTRVEFYSIIGTLLTVGGLALALFLAFR